MKYCNLGGIRASSIVMVCMRIADKSLEHTEKTIVAAMSSGVNMFDLADVYAGGDSERIFGVAMRDLEIRGPGEFLGARQSGTPMVRFANLETDVELVEAARDFAGQWLSIDPERAKQHAKRWYSAKEGFLEA